MNVHLTVVSWRSGLDDRNVGTCSCSGDGDFADIISPSHSKELPLELSSPYEGSDLTILCLPLNREYDVEDSPAVTSFSVYADSGGVDARLLLCMSKIHSQQQSVGMTSNRLAFSVATVAATSLAE